MVSGTLAEQRPDDSSKFYDQGFMTKTSFVIRNSFRNKRRSILTMLSIGFSLLLLTLMMTIWRSFYIDQGAPDSAKRVITRHRVSLTFLLPTYYRDKIRSLPGVVAVVPMTFFGGKYKDDRPENSFAQFATDPSEYLKVATDKIVPPDQALAVAARPCRRHGGRRVSQEVRLENRRPHSFDRYRSSR